MAFFTGDSSVEFLVNLPMAGINAAITDHFVMFFRDMLDETLYELHDRDGFFHIFAIFMAVVVKSDKIAIIIVNPGSGDDRAAEITADVLYNCFRIAFVWLGMHIEAIFMLPVALGFNLFKGSPDFCFHFIEERSPEGIAEEGVVKVIDIAPEAIIAVSAFRDEAVDMWVPFQVPAKGVEDHDKAGGEVHGLVLFEKHAGNNAAYSMKKAVKEGAVIQEKIPELCINGKNTMPVGGINEFKGRGCSALHGVEVSAGRAETAFAAERDEFQLSAMGTAVHCPAKGRVSAVNHFFHVFNDGVAWM